jgi:hypothetical protein
MKIVKNGGESEETLRYVITKIFDMLCIAYAIGISYHTLDGSKACDTIFRFYFCNYVSGLTMGIGFDMSVGVHHCFLN